MKTQFGTHVQMPNVCEILKQWTGSPTVTGAFLILEERDDYIKTERPNPAIMPLVIEIVRLKRVPHRPYDGALIMSHNYVQNGDLMDDPLVDFWVQFNYDWDTMTERVFFLPCTFAQSSIGVYHEYIRDGLLLDESSQDSLATFCRQWDENLGQQGFVDLAKKRGGTTECTTPTTERRQEHE